MAPRVSDFPPDEEWPDLEDERTPSTFPIGGAYGGALELLHGARITLDAGLLGPTRVLAAHAARLGLRTAEREGSPATDAEADALGPLARGELATEAETLLDALTELAVFVERRAQAK